MRLPSAPMRGVLVDQPDAVRAAALERGVEIVDGEADVMNARARAWRRTCRSASPGDFGLQELDERRTGGQADDLRAVGVVERHVGQPEHVAIERDALVRALRTAIPMCAIVVPLRGRSLHGD